MESRKWKDSSQDRKKFLQIIYLAKDQYLDYIKNYYNSTLKRQIAQLKNGQRIWIDISPKKVYT